jgi:hypothetical protein
MSANSRRVQQKARKTPMHAPKRGGFGVSEYTGQSGHRPQERRATAEMFWRNSRCLCSDHQFCHKSPVRWTRWSRCICRLSRMTSRRHDGRVRNGQIQRKRWRTERQPKPRADRLPIERSWWRVESMPTGHSRPHNALDGQQQRQKIALLWA